MINNGYGNKTFGLFKESGNPNKIKIIVIYGNLSLSNYPYTNYAPMNSEINNYFANNPAQKTSEHTLVIAAVPNQATANVPFYGLGKTCFALDYPQFNIQYLGTNTYEFTKWFGGMMHELGHGLNLPHSKQTNSENSDPDKGMNLMSSGNYTLGSLPTFINRAGAAILSNCQVFAAVPGVTYYNGHNASLTGVQTSYSNGILTVSGTFQSDKPVTDVNIYQDPHPLPHSAAGEAYDRKAWSVPPSGNTFSVNMPVSELEITNGQYNLQIELVLKNGETTFNYYPFSYANGVPDINVNYGTLASSETDSISGHINIYPNPTTDELNIRLESGHPGYDIEINDASGRLVYKNLISDDIFTLSLAEFSPGKYTIKLKSKNYVKSFPIIKK